MPKSGVIGFVGPTGAGGVPFQAWLTSQVLCPDLVELVLASAYLTDGAADEIVVGLQGRDPTWTRPTITILVGQKDGFTRSSAIKTLLRAKADWSIRATFRVRCPNDLNFHVKAGYSLTGMSTHRAVIGSHNLTKSGLMAVSELGVRLAGRSARELRVALRFWESNSKDWKKVRYKERELLPPSMREKGSKHPAPSADVNEELAPAGEFAGLSDRTSDGQAKRMDAATRKFKKAHPSLARRVGLYFFEERSIESSVGEAGYVPGARLVLTQHYPDNREGDWWDGQRMKIAEVEHLLPARKNETVVACRVLLNFKSNATVRDLAKRTGARRQMPTPQGLAEFTREVRKLKRRGKA